MDSEYFESYDFKIIQNKIAPLSDYEQPEYSQSFATNNDLSALVDFYELAQPF